MSTHEPAPDRGLDYYGFDDLLALGLTETAARAVLGAAFAVHRDEVGDRLGMYRRERRDRPPGASDAGC